MYLSFRHYEYLGKTYKALALKDKNGWHIRFFSDFNPSLNTL
jgi:hypothetical protein